MIGIMFGLACGAVELYLLHKLVRGVTSGGAVPIWVVPTKMAVLALFFVPCALIAKDQLHLAGIAASAVLIFGAVGYFSYRRAAQKKQGKRGGLA